MADGDGREKGTTQYVLTLDVGSSSLRAHIYDKQGHKRGSSYRDVVTVSPEPTFHEIEPEPFFNSIVECVRETIKDAGLSPSQVSCLGITTQRCTFITWDSVTGKTFHNFISWLDLRSREIVKRWNSSFTMKFVHTGAKFIHLCTKSDRYKAIGGFKLSTLHVTPRLLWVIEHIVGLKDRIKEGRVMFGCIDTWITWRLTRGKVFATDYSCASATSLYDPFELKWNRDFFRMLNIPSKLRMPEVRDTSGDFGSCDPNLFGAPIPITCLIADQQSAMFGQCCFDAGDIKCTMGTGSFVSVNTGQRFHISHKGLLSMIAWKIGDEVTYMTEGVVSDTGKAINWAQQVGLLSDISQSGTIAQSVPDSGGVSFVSSLGGSKMPLNDDGASAPYVGSTPHTSKAHIVRAILESCAFRIKLLYNVICNEIGVPLTPIKTDGGMSQNDFLMQLVSDFTHQSLERSQTSDMTSLGAAFLAGLSRGVWKDRDELRSLRRTDAILFNPRDEMRWSNYQPAFQRWTKAFTKAQKCVKCVSEPTR